MKTRFQQGRRGRKEDSISRSRRPIRYGSMSLEVLIALAIILAISVTAFNLARKAYRGLYFIISTWVGSPFF